MDRAKKTAVFLCALLALFTVGCGVREADAPAASPSGGQAQYPLTFTDALGNEITLQSPPQKTAVLLASTAEIWQTAGGTVSITVGDAVERGFAPEGTPLVDDGSGMKIDVERLAALQPDFVIGSADTPAQVQACEQLQKLGIPAAVFREDCFEDYLEMLRLFTRITGNAQAYEQYGQAVQQQVQQVREEAQQNQAQMPKVLLLRAGSGDSSTRAKTAKDHFVGVMLQELGAQNIADEAGALSERLSLEHVVANPPDVVLVTTQGDEAAAIAYLKSVFAQPGWQAVPAIREGRVYYLDRQLFHYKPNARWGEAYATLYALLLEAGNAQ